MHNFFILIDVDQILVPKIIVPYMWSFFNKKGLLGKNSLPFLLAPDTLIPYVKSTQMSSKCVLFVGNNKSSTPQYYKFWQSCTLLNNIV